MKKSCLIGLCLLLFFSGGILYAQNVMSLESAVERASRAIESDLTRGATVAVLNFNSPTIRFSEYVLDELMEFLVNGRTINVVDRANLDRVRREMNFQMSGEVSDESAQSIGRLLGAQSIVLGSAEYMGGFYRVRFRTIEVETGRIQVMSSFNVQNDTLVHNLMAGRNPIVTPAPLVPTAPAPAAPAPAPAVRGPAHFTTGQKIGMGFSNGLFGLGSFIMGDPLGGLMISGMQATSYFFLLSGLIRRNNAYWYHEDNITYGWSGNSHEFDWEWYDHEMSAAITQLIIGGAVYVGGAIIQWWRPFIFDNKLRKKAALADENNPVNSVNPINRVSFTPFFDRKGALGMKVLYNWSY